MHSPLNKYLTIFKRAWLLIPMITKRPCIIGCIDHQIFIIADQHTLDQGQQLAALAHAHSMSAWVASFDKRDQTIL